MGRMQVYLMAIKFSREEMQEMENLISVFFSTKQINLAAPVDIFKLATELGFDVRGAEFDGQIEGLIVVNEHVEKIGGFESNKVIAYNCSKSIETKKFIVAHELAHYISKKANAQGEKIVVAARDHAASYSEDKEEQRMDYIAASLLMPRNELCQFLQSDDNIPRIMERFKVPEELARRRVEEVQI